MARFNTGARTLVISGTTTLSYAFTGGIVTLSGAGTYTVTVASPVSFPGTTQLFYNGSSAAITLATPVGQIRGPGFTNGAFQTIEAGASMTLVSDGSNYIISNTEGNIVVGTSATFTGTLIAATQLGSAASGGTQIIRGTSHATKAAASILMDENVTSTSTTTGTLVVTGGVGVSENLYVGGSAVRFTSNSASTSTSSGTLVVTGGVGVGGRINASDFTGTVGANTANTGAFTTLSANNTVSLTANQSATNTSTGTLRVTGGVSCTENLWVGGYIDAASMQDTPIGTVTRSTAAFTTLTANNSVTFTQNASSSNTSSGTLVVTGGVGISENLFVGGASVRFTGNSGSSGTSSGTLVVTGGVGITQNCYVGSALVAGSLSETSSMTLKKDINPITNALDKILNLEGVTYYRKADDTFEAGLIAEHVNKIIPELVGKDSDGNPQTVYYTKITAYLIEAVKSLKQELDSLKGKN